MTRMNEKFKADYYRMTGKQWTAKSIVDLFTRYDLRYLLHIRSSKHILYTVLSLRASRKYGLEILSENIGDGLYIGHAHNINVHPAAVIATLIRAVPLEGRIEETEMEFRPLEIMFG